jgi:hypothetical protein
MKYVPDTKLFIVENELHMYEAFAILESKQNIFTLSIDHITDGNVDEIIFWGHTKDDNIIDGTLNETDIFSNEEKNVFFDLFSKQSGLVSLQGLSLGKFTFMDGNHANLRYVYWGHDQRSIDAWMLRSSYFEDMKNGWYIMVTPLRDPRVY